MKKIVKLSLFALFLGLFSCDNATDIVQESELNEENAFRTVEDLRSGLIGVYAAYAPDAGSNGTGDVLFFSDVFTDNVKRGVDSNGQGSTEYSFILQPGTQFTNTLWSNRYAVINFANRVLRAWDRIVPELEDEQLINEANEIKGQLLAWRAFAHLDLLQYYTPDYSNLSSPSIIIVDFVPDLNDSFPRNTVGEVYEFINNDLIDAKEFLGDFSTLDTFTTNPSEFKYYLHSDAIDAIRTRLALVQGNYALAETLATELLNEYQLSDVEDYFEMFNSDRITATELIFSLSRRQGDREVTNLWAPNGPGPEGNPFFEISDQLVNLYDDDDVRFIVTVNTVALGDGLQLINKYPGSGDGPKINDIKIFRSAEMLFIKAEAAARDNRLGEAAQLIQQLRSERSLSNATADLPVYSTTNQALRDILMERRLEFAFEGHRYLDLKRLGTELGIGVERDESDCASFSAPCSLSPGDFRFTLPIPRNEISANPGIQQNPGY